MGFKQDILRTSALSAVRNQKMQKLAEHDHLKWWSAPWYVASCHQISGSNVISSHYLIWVIFPRTGSKPTMENLKVSWNTQKLAEHSSHFKKQSSHKLPVQRHWPAKIYFLNWTWSSKFQNFNAKTEIAICYMVLCIIPPHCRPIEEIHKELEQ